MPRVKLQHGDVTHQFASHARGTAVPCRGCSRREWTGLDAIGPRAWHRCGTRSRLLQWLVAGAGCCEGCQVRPRLQAQAAEAGAGGVDAVGDGQDGRFPFSLSEEMRDEPDTMYGTVPSAAQKEHAADWSATLLRESTPTGDFAPPLAPNGY